MDDRCGMGSEEDGVDEGEAWVRATTVAQVRSRGAVQTQIDGREVVLVLAPDGSVACLDARCYHHGGELAPGKVKHVGGRACIVCPWHKYPITLDTGEGLYTALDGVVKSKGVMQRVHPVRVTDNGHIWVRLAVGGPRIESDTYADPQPEPDADGVVVLPNGARVIYPQPRS
ncbi:Rieske domain containing [Thecamonas trahens ATCC 50062]|uniref:Rieske domain containing n=1 Tax=Thecamonas trahens ATCC 50062 TaxID=461836 RepID=A0A0L0D285_THETB|nr:Rieske domain containing [Thecamonas trahens ATCC 50062]KNC46397.1 Rieske domain containing [Thecamonas trahens ATCC 50062]|eukprot:XP_013760690.1 Rieske domain containing [Thecamonas trahens ATCC 50062]